VTLEDIARVCHEANRAYCEALGDHSQVPWDKAPEWQRKSAVTGVIFIAEHPDASPGITHASWLAEKLQDGWEYGPVKDPSRKKHPSCVPFDELSPAEQAKDYIFTAIARTMLSLERADA
jgi:hypothetical protein